MEKLKVIDSETLLNTPFPKQFFVVEGLIPQGLSVFCGQSKIGKSWLMLYMGLQVSQGLPVMGCNTNKCDVLYLCLEDTYPRLRDRVYKLSDTGSPNLYLTIMAGGIGTGIEEQIEDFLADYPETRFIMIDTLQKIRDNNKPSSKQGIYGDDYDDISSIKAIADKHNIAIMLVHHVRKLKDSEDPFNEISGSNGIAGAADTAFVFKKQTFNGNTATLYGKGRDIEFQELTLRQENLIWNLVEHKTKEEIQKDSAPPFLFKLVEFMKNRNEWHGTATELLNDLEDNETAAVAVTKNISYFYYDILYPECISYKTRRTGSRRLIELRRRDANDENDGSDSIQK